MNTRFIFAGAGALVGALLVFVVTQSPFDGVMPLSESDGDNQQTITQTSPNSFGPLANSGQDAANEAISDMSFRSQSGGGGGNPAPSMAMDEKMMIYPVDYRQTRYTYDGALTLPEGDVQVYRRVRNTSKPSASNAISGFADGMIDWSSFGSLGVQSISVTQPGNDAYTFYVDYSDGSISMHRNFSGTTRPEMLCQDSDCYERMRLTEDDMLPDEEVIQIAQDFLADHGFDRSKFGEPSITDDWRIMLSRSSDRMAFYFPEQMNVTFPLLIDGLPVYEEYGTPYGLTVSVDIRSKQVSSVYNYQTLSFEQSAYAAVTDEARVREVMAAGSLYSWTDPNAEVVNATLGEPTQGLVRMSHWDQSKQLSSDLYVPALVFPITDLPTDSMETRTRVVVPLAAELLKAPEYMPLIDATVPTTEPAVREDAVMY